MTQASCEHITAVRSDLRSATHAHRLAKLSQVASCFGAGIGLVGLLLVLTIQSVFSPNGLTAWAMISLPFLTLVLSVLGFVKTRHLQKTRNALLDNAYGLAILELMSKSTTGATPVQLAESFGIQPSIAERLLAQLNVRDDMTSEVTDDGQIADFNRNLSRYLEKNPKGQVETERLRVPEGDASPDNTTTVNGDAQSPNVNTQVSSVTKS